MRTILISDLHFALYGQDPIVAESGLPERLHHLNKVLRDDIVGYAKANEINKIVIAGDVNHTKSVIHSLAQSILLDFIRDSSDIEFTVIDGNHDMSSKSGMGVSALKCLDQEPNVLMLHETKQIENVLFVPWNAQTMIKDIKTGTTPFLISHLGLNEGKLNSGISIISDIGLKDLVQYKHCYFGHYHSPQTVGNATYIGSIIQMDWGEKHEEKRFIVFDSETGSSTSIPTQSYKKYYELNITEESKAEVIKEAEKLKSSGHHIKINVVEPVDVTDIEGSFNVIDKTEKDITNRGITTSMSLDDKLNRYLEIKEIPQDQREAYLNVAKIIIDRCAGG